MSKTFSFSGLPTLAELRATFPPLRYEVLARSLDDAQRTCESHGIGRAPVVDPVPSGGITIRSSVAVPRNELWLMDGDKRLAVLKLREDEP